MKVVDVIGDILKREGVEFVIGYPVNHIFEAAARNDIRTIVVRQERVGLHMADAISRVSSGRRLGVFIMQHGPGTENAFGGVAQAFADSVPILVMPGAYPRNMNNVKPNFSSYLNYQHVTKSCEQVNDPAEAPGALRRAFTQLRNGRPGPCLIEWPIDVLDLEFPGELHYNPAPRHLQAPDPADVSKAAQMLVDARRPVIYAGQGVHYAQAWSELRELAELLEAPVTSSLQGKSAFPETHELSLGSGNRTIGGHLAHFLNSADVVFGIGCSFTRTNYGVAMPKGKTMIQATQDPLDLNKQVPIDHGILGDARLVLQGLLAEVRERIKQPRGLRAGVAQEITTHRDEWLAQWKHKRDSDDAPLNPYRVLKDLRETVDPDKTIITHDAGSPRDQLAPFWSATAPLSYLGWGKTTQLGYGLGLAMGAKLAEPDKLCINVWGDAAIGFTGMDFETAVRERIPILSILLNNFSMAIELKVMPVSTEKYRSTDISGNYADFANALGGYGERVTKAADIVPAIKRGIQKTQEGTPVLLEFITSKEVDVSLHPIN